MADWYTKPEAKAHCMTCGWSCFKANAHGAGAQHAKRHGHEVRVEVYTVFVYGSTQPSKTPVKPTNG